MAPFTAAQASPARPLYNRPRPRLGQACLVIDPVALAGRDAFSDRLEGLLTEMQRDPGVHLPGERLEALRRAAERDGLTFPVAVLQPVTD